MTNFKNLIAWQKAMELVKETYLLLKKYPKDELFGLISRTKRAVISIPSNIAEGAGRNYKRDTVQFLHIARGSLYELETLFHIAVMTSIVTEAEFAHISRSIDETHKILNGLINSFERRNDLK